MQSQRGRKERREKGKESSIAEEKKEVMERNEGKTKVRMRDK